MEDQPWRLARIETTLQGSGPEAALRTAPHNLEAEQALLGAILVNNEAWMTGAPDFLTARSISTKRSMAGFST